MIFAMVIGVISAFVVLICISRINLKRFMGYPATMDLLVTVFLAWLLHGSYVGMVAAVIGGLFFSGMITVIRRCYGYARLERKGFRLVWVEYPGTWINAKEYFNSTEKGKLPCLNLQSSKVLVACIAVLFALACVL